MINSISWTLGKKYSKFIITIQEIDLGDNSIGIMVDTKIGFCVFVAIVSTITFCISFVLHLNEFIDKKKEKANCSDIKTKYCYSIQDIY